jgi:hypothetical protein
LFLEDEFQFLEDHPAALSSGLPRLLKTCRRDRTTLKTRPADE